MRNAQVTGSRLHVHTFRIIRAHRIDLGAMTFNYPPFLAPDEAIASGPWPGRHILAALGLPKEQSLVGSSPAFSPMLGSLSVSDRGKREGHFHLSNFLDLLGTLIIYAFLTFSVLLWRLNPYLLQATKKGSSITI